MGKAAGEEETPELGGTETQAASSKVKIVDKNGVKEEEDDKSKKEKKKKGKKVPSVGTMPKTPEDFLKTSSQMLALSASKTRSGQMSSSSRLLKPRSKTKSGRVKSSSKQKQSTIEEEDSEESGEWSWESYYSDESVEEKEEEKKKKGKKKKKQKDETEATVVEEAPEVVEELDPEAEKERLKQEMLAALLAEEEAAKKAEEEEAARKKAEEEKAAAKKAKKTAEKSVDETSVVSTSAAPSVKEKKPKEKREKKPKKLTPKQMAALKEKEEQERIQAEIAAKIAAEEERLRLIEEKRAGIEKENRETTEQILRKEQLQSSTNHIRNMIEHDNALALKASQEESWYLYLTCDGLPDPSNCPQMSMYIHMWEKIMDNMKMKEVGVKMKEVLHLLEKLDDLIMDAYGVPLRLLNNWKWIRKDFRDHLQDTLDASTYRLLRNITENMNRTSLETADFHHQDENFKLSIWLKVQLPIPGFNPRAPPVPRVDLNFEQIQLKVLFPTEIKCDQMAVRAIYLTYDHLSDLSATYSAPPVPQEYDCDLYDVAMKEWREKLKYKFDNRDLPVQLDEEGNPIVRTPPLMSADIKDDEEVPIVPWKKLEPSASEHVISVEDEFYEKIREGLPVTTDDEDVINLRRNYILGGVYYLDLVYQPPQPFEMVSFKIIMSNLKVADALERVPFCAEYTPPPPPDPDVVREPEEIERELKEQEVLLDKLLLITLTLPEQAMFLELPSVCRWDPEGLVWTRKNVFDLKHNEEKGYLTFRTGLFGCFALYTNKFINLPFQTWEMKSEIDGSITLQLTSAILYFEFNIKGDKVALTQLQNAPKEKPFPELIGTYLKLPKLIRTMKAKGISVFPSLDAFAYVEGTCEKHWPMEKHLYYNMGQISIAYNFAWSRWNVTAGRRNVILQMREWNPNKPTNRDYSMLHVTPLYARYINCTEVSPEFTDEPAEGMKFYSDLMHLMKGTSNMTLKAKVLNFNLQMAKTVADLLKSTRLLSFCQ